MGQKHSQSDSRPSSSSSRPGSARLPRTSHMPQVSQLAKILISKGEKEGVSGISADIFAKHVFPSYQDLGKRLFIYFLNECRNSIMNEESLTKEECINPPNMTGKEFCRAVEHIFVTQINDELQLDMCLRMYGENGHVTQDGFRELLVIAYTIAVDHYSGGPAHCKHYSRTINAVIVAAFHHKKSLSRSYLCQWILSNCPRLAVGLHRYVVHNLSTAYRLDESTTGLEASTPVLDEKPDFSEGNKLLPLSEVWLLSVSLPELYTRPSTPARNSPANGLTSQTMIAKLLGSLCPSHWTPLYKSGEDGLGSNRFNLHVMNYRGPTIMVIKCESDMEFCVASSTEWKESHLYWGSKDCALLQLQPEFHCLARDKDKILYYNESIRGYPKGIRVGADPQHPIIEINSDFTHLSYVSAPYTLLEMQVWGCGSEQHREAQLDFKRIQIKDAEKHRKVKINPEDWVDNPDRYLLQLAGHPSYNREGSRGMPPVDRRSTDSGHSRRPS